MFSRLSFLQPGSTPSTTKKPLPDSVNNSAALSNDNLSIMPLPPQPTAQPVRQTPNSSYTKKNIHDSRRDSSFSSLTSESTLFSETHTNSMSSTQSSKSTFSTPASPSQQTTTSNSPKDAASLLARLNKSSCVKPIAIDESDPVSPLNDWKTQVQTVSPPNRSRANSPTTGFYRSRGPESNHASHASRNGSNPPSLATRKNRPSYRTESKEERAARFARSMYARDSEEETEDVNRILEPEEMMAMLVKQAKDRRRKAEGMNAKSTDTKSDPNSSGMSDTKELQTADGSHSVNAADSMTTNEDEEATRTTSIEALTTQLEEYKAMIEAKNDEINNLYARVDIMEDRIIAGQDTIRKLENQIKIDRIKRRRSNGYYTPSIASELGISSSDVLKLLTDMEIAYDSTTTILLPPSVSSLRACPVCSRALPRAHFDPNISSVLSNPENVDPETLWRVRKQARSHLDFWRAEHWNCLPKLAKIELWCVE